ncbi:hypothetical protein HAX54_046690, partial [Datura stramonium]|nr:hypothetical protein [Datura stramonium]
DMGAARITGLRAWGSDELKKGKGSTGLVGVLGVGSGCRRLVEEGVGRRWPGGEGRC